jgi:hypothetical protein
LISPKPVTGYIAKKKGNHFENKNEKIIKMYVLDIPKYSFIILYSDNEDISHYLYPYYISLKNKDMSPGKTNVRGLERHPDIYPFLSISKIMLFFLGVPL